MPLKPYEEFAPEPLAFPIGGKVYTVPDLPWQDGIRLTRILSGEDHSLDDADATEGWRLVMGAAWDEMLADNVSGPAMARAGLAALSDFKFGREAAERVWESGIDPKALTEAIAASQAQTPSPSTDAASSTPSPASTTGTTSPKATRRRAKKVAASPSPSST